MKIQSQIHSASLLHKKLEGILDNLSTGFIEKRSRTMSHKPTLIEELEVVVNEIRNKENELKNVANIALSLLEESERFQSKTEKLKSKIVWLREKNHHQNLEISSLKSTLSTYETRNTKLDKALMKTEEMMLIKTAELIRASKVRTSVPSTSASEEDVERIKEDFHMQIKCLQKRLWELERANKVLRETDESNQKELSLAQKDSENLEKRMKKLCKDLEESEKINRSYRLQLESLDFELASVKLDNSRLKDRAEKLTEDLSLSEIKDVPALPKLKHISSLQSELEFIVQNEDLFCVNPDTPVEGSIFSKHSRGKSSTVKLDKLNLTCIENIFNTTNCQSIYVPPTWPSRKSPPEEYFMLAMQSVKMNSPHFKEVNVPADELYKKAIKDGISFHKWHTWIETQLNAAYVQKVYKNKKSIWRRFV